MSQEIIFAAIPHREPFLFIDKVLECTETKVVCEKTFTGEEDFFRGHYPHSPIVPGVILCEAGMQAGAVLISHKMQKKLADVADMEAEVAKLKNKIPVVVKMTDIRFRQIVRPGETVQVMAEMEESVSRAHRMKATILKDGKPAVKLSYVVMFVDNEAEASE